MPFERPLQPVDAFRASAHGILLLRIVFLSCRSLRFSSAEQVVISAKSIAFSGANGVDGLPNTHDPKMPCIRIGDF